MIYFGEILQVKIRLKDIDKRSKKRYNDYTTILFPSKDGKTQFDNCFLDIIKVGLYLLSRLQIPKGKLWTRLW